eukprot:jgi/Psemu1/250191/estExt_Genewise1Plus.C_130092
MESGPTGSDAEPSPSSSRRDEGNKHNQRDNVLLVIFASLSTFLYAGGAYGWGPMQLLLEVNGNFANLCEDYDYETITASNSTSTTSAGEAPAMICPDQTAAFLNCRFWAMLTFLTGTLWGALSDRYGKTVLMYNFGGSTVLGLVLLIVAVRFPRSSFQGPFLYTASILIALGAITGAMLTVETGLLFRNNPKQKNRVIALLNALFDAGALTYLGLWGLEQIAPATLAWILGAYLCLAVISIGGYAYFFQRIATGTKIRDDVDGQYSVDGATEGDKQSNTLPPTAVGVLADTKGNSAATGDCDLEGSIPTGPLTKGFPSPSQFTNNDDPYIPIAQRPPKDQLKSRVYILLGIFYSFHTISNLWTLTAARDFLGSLGDDQYGNRYLGIYTLMTPISITALPFLDVVINRFGFHAALQSVNALAMVHGIIRVSSTDLNVQILGFVVYSFFRCFLYAAGLSCLADFISLGATGRATGTLFVLAGVASFFNIGMTHLAIDVFEGNFFVPDMIFLLLNVPMVLLTWWLGMGLRRDQRARNENKDDNGCSTTISF